MEIIPPYTVPALRLQARLRRLELQPLAPLYPPELLRREMEGMMILPHLPRDLRTKPEFLAQCLLYVRLSKIQIPLKERSLHPDSFNFMLLVDRSFRDSTMDFAVLASAVEILVLRYDPKSRRVQNRSIGG